jgi:hypothetical protein
MLFQTLLPLKCFKEKSFFNKLLGIVIDFCGALKISELVPLLTVSVFPDNDILTLIVSVEIVVFLPSVVVFADAGRSYDTKISSFPLGIALMLKSLNFKSDELKSGYFAVTDASAVVLMAASVAPMTSLV